MTVSNLIFRIAELLKRCEEVMSHDGGDAMTLIAKSWAGPLRERLLADRWISTVDELPPEGEDVLVIEGGKRFIARGVGDGWDCGDPDGTVSFDSITLWHRLPPVSP